MNFKEINNNFNNINSKKEARLNVMKVKNGTVLPVKLENNYFVGLGGVLDENNNFIQSSSYGWHHYFNYFGGQYAYKNKIYSNERVIYRTIC